MNASELFENDLTLNKALPKMDPKDMLLVDKWTLNYLQGQAHPSESGNPGQGGAPPADPVLGAQPEAFKRFANGVCGLLRKGASSYHLVVLDSAEGARDEMTGVSRARLGVFKPFQSSSFHGTHLKGNLSTSWFFCKGNGSRPS